MDKKAVVLNTDGKILSQAIIDSMTSSGAILIPESQELLSSLEEGTKIRFGIFRKYLEVYEGEIASIGTDRFRISQLRDSEVNARQDVKIDVDYNGTISYEQDNKPINCSVKIRDLSCGGFCFASRVDLDVNKCYETVVPLTKEPLVLNFKIVRKLREEKTFIYGCKFLDLEDTVERMLRETVYRLLALKCKRKI